MGYGVVFDTPELIRSAAHDVSRDTHGSHVAAIAASSADVYKGMAPESDIVVVATDKSESRNHRCPCLSARLRREREETDGYKS